VGNCRYNPFSATVLDFQKSYNLNVRNDIVLINRRVFLIAAHSNSELTQRNMDTSTFMNSINDDESSDYGKIYHLITNFENIDASDMKKYAIVRRFKKNIVILILNSGQHHDCDVSSSIYHDLSRRLV
jgi:hypothetical protein